MKNHSCNGTPQAHPVWDSALLLTWFPPKQQVDIKTFEGMLPHGRINVALVLTYISIVENLTCICHIEVHGLERLTEVPNLRLMGTHTI